MKKILIDISMITTLIFVVFSLNCMIYSCNVLTKSIPEIEKLSEEIIDEELEDLSKTQEIKNA